MILIVFLFSLISFTAYAESVDVTDIAGRKVTINQPVQRAMLADSRVLLALNILHPSEPLKGIVAWDDAFIKKTPDLSMAFKAKKIPIDRVPVFPNPYQSDFSVENALQYNPDLIIFDIGLKDRLEQLDVLNKLHKVNIPVIFVDFRQHPVKNTVPSMRILGTVFSQQENAEKFISFYNGRLDLIRERVKDIPYEKRPVVIVERHAGLLEDDPCCVIFGKGGFGEFVDAAGGRNLGDQWFNGLSGQINPEQLITHSPDFYLMTAADWRNNRPKSNSVPLGYFANKDEVIKYYHYLVNRQFISVLTSAKERNILAIYHQYYDSPFNILAIETIAKFIYPDKFKDIDPSADNTFLHNTFTAIENTGIFWFSGKENSGG